MDIIDAYPALPRNSHSAATSAYGHPKSSTMAPFWPPTEAGSGTLFHTKCTGSMMSVAAAPLASAAVAVIVTSTAVVASYLNTGAELGVGSRLVAYVTDAVWSFRKMMAVTIADLPSAA